MDSHTAMYIDNTTNQHLLYAAGTQTDDQLNSEEQTQNENYAEAANSYEELRDNLRTRYGGYSLAQLVLKFESHIV